MGRPSGAVHVVRVRKSHVDKQGQRRDYQSAYLRRTFRVDGKVRNETVANLSALPAHVVDWVDAGLKGQSLVPADQAAIITRSVPHGHVTAVWAQAAVLGMPTLLGPAGRRRDLVMALVISRVLHPGSKLATASWWDDTTLGADLGVAGASTDEVYAAMDWLLERQDQVQATLARRHLAPDSNPGRMAMFDLSSSWMEGSHCPLAKRGYSRDGKKNRTQIEYGLLTDPAGRPVAIKVFAGNTADPTAFIHAVEMIREQFKLTKMVLVGDRGMITSARIDALRAETQLGWLTSLRAPAIKALAAAGGPLQPTLFDQQNLAEITHPDYPGERLVACRNPFLAAARAHKRDELLTATEILLAPVHAAVTAGRLAGADQIGLRVGKIINTHKMAKHLQVTITDTTLTITRRTGQIEAEAALDGIYVIRTTVPADTLDAPGVVTAYKNLARVERDFRTIKVDDLDLRPIYHHLENRVRAHVFLVMLAAYLTWHLRRTLAPLTFTDETPPARTDPVAPAHRSTAATRKASHRKDQTNQPVRSFRALLDHLATLTRNNIQYGAGGPVVPTLTVPTETQRRVFELLHTAIPLNLK